MKRFYLKALVFVIMIIGLSTCSKSESGGIFTLTDIPPEFNGASIWLVADFSDGIGIGVQNIDRSEKDLYFTFSVIRNGKVNIPMWFIDDEKLYDIRSEDEEIINRADIVERYSGTGRGQLELHIMKSKSAKTNNNELIFMILILNMIQL